MKGSKQTK